MFMLPRRSDLPSFLLSLIWIWLSPCSTFGYRIIQPFKFPSPGKIGDRAIVPCAVSALAKEGTFAWFKDGIPLEEDDNIRLSFDKVFSVLTINSLEARHQGNYSCQVETSLGKDSYSAFLSVQVPPYWNVKPPPEVLAKKGQRLVVLCEASGSPPPKIHWSRLKENLEAVTSDVPSTERRELVLNSILEKDGGKYQCTADNSIGPPLQATTHITVHVPAKFEERYTLVNAKKSESAKLKCDAQGDQPLSITWTKDGELLDKAGDLRYEIFETLTSSGIMSEVILRSTEREDAGLYTCEAENEFGKDERKIRLMLVEVPSAPSNLRIREVWSRSVSVTWDPPYSGNSAITSYIVQYWRNQASQRLQEVTVSSAQASALIKELHPGTDHHLRLLAENAVGRGNVSDPITFRTGEEEPSSPPMDVVIEGRGSTTIRVAWKPPPRESWNGVLLGYYVGFRVKDSRQPYSFKTVAVESADGNEPAPFQEYFLSHLMRGVEYSVVVKAYNSAGSGPASQETVVRTLEGDLPPAPSLYVLSTSPSSVALKWTNKKTETPIIGYTVFYRMEGRGEWEEASAHVSDDGPFTLTGLETGRHYQIYVTASNHFGRGDPSEVVVVKTTDGYGGFGVARLAGSSDLTDLAVVVPVAVSMSTIIVVVVVACVCVRKIRTRQQVERVLAMEKQQALMAGTIQRYVDIDKTRIVAGDHYPAPYSAIPMDEEMRTYSPDPNAPVPYPKSESLRRKIEHIYDCPQ